MKKVFYLLVLSIIYTTAYSQNFPNPKIWLRADNQGNVINKWIDVSGNGFDATTQNNQIIPDSGLFNFHNCFVFDSLSNPLKINFTANKDEKLLVFAVYKPNTTLEEKGIWSLDLDSTIQVKLTTQHLKNIYKFIKYSNSTQDKPTINSWNQNWNNRNIDSTNSGLLIGGSDSLNFTGKFAEFLLFDNTLEENQTTKIHTYLAIKYGVSLLDMNYMSSDNEILWDYTANINYKYDIAAIGKDTGLYINQKQSSGNGGESVLKISAGKIQAKNDENQSILNQGDFVFWGNNGQSVGNIDVDTTVISKVWFISDCHWKMNRIGTTANQIMTQVVFNARDIANLQKVALVINRNSSNFFATNSSEIILPDSLDSDSNFYFSNVYWDTDNSGSDVFSFQLTKTFIATNIENQKPKNIDNNPIIDCSLFPNPTIKEYNVTVKLTQEMPITVCIYDQSGKIIDKFIRNGASEYKLNGVISNTGCYLLKIETGTYSKTYKLIVE